MCESESVGTESVEKIRMQSETVSCVQFNFIWAFIIEGAILWRLTVRDSAAHESADLQRPIQN